MNCERCHHTYEAHRTSDTTKSLLMVDKCQIPGCTCQQYLDAIKQIDEDLL